MIVLGNDNDDDGRGSFDDNGRKNGDDDGRSNNDAGRGDDTDDDGYDNLDDNDKNVVTKTARIDKNNTPLITYQCMIVATNGHDKLFEGIFAVVT